MENQTECYSVSPAERSSSDSQSISKEGSQGFGDKHRQIERLKPCFCFWQWAFGCVALLYLTVGMVFAFTTAFGQFRSYDDEGRLMISVQGFLEGNSLYDKVATHYGPIYYFYEWVLHKVVAIPLTSDATAALCVAHWIFAATMLAWVAFRMTRSTLLAAFVFMQATVHLDSLANEPGHPQEIVVMMLCVAALVAVGGVKQRRTLPLLAAIGTALLFTKINVGGFFGMALALSMLCCTPGGRMVRIGAWGLTLISGTMPLLLIRSHYDQTWARYYGLEMALSVLAVGLVANVFVTERVVVLRDWARAAIVSIVISVFVLFTLLVTGSPLMAVWGSLVSGAAKIGGIFYIPVHLEYWSWSAWTALITATLVACLKKRGAVMLAALPVIKVVYGLMGTWVLVFEPALQLGCLLPWAWLLLVGTKKNDEDLFPRIFLSFLAVWQGLQAYPVAGTQVSVGTLIGVLVFSVCLWDALKMFAGASFLKPPLQKVTSLGGGRMIQIIALLLLLMVFSFKWCEPLLKWQQYQAKEPLDLSGCHYRRILPADVVQYRELAAFLKSKSDTFIILPGLNSMYFWTGQKPPTYFNVNGEGIMPTEPQQMEVVEALKRAKHPLVVVRGATWAPGTPHGDMEKGPLADFIHDECDQVATFSQFKIFAPKQSRKVSG